MSLRLFASISDFLNSNIFHEKHWSTFRFWWLRPWCAFVIEIGGDFLLNIICNLCSSCVWQLVVFFCHICNLFCITRYGIKLIRDGDADPGDVMSVSIMGQLRSQREFKKDSLNLLFKDAFIGNFWWSFVWFPTWRHIDYR